MKASEIISNLNELIKEHGDREIEVNGEYNNDYPVNTASRLSVSRIDLFADSDNFQIIIDNSI